MKPVIFITVLVATIISSGCQSQSAQDLDRSRISVSPAATGEKQPVLVELYTSEGCSSCPPADKVLTILQNDQFVPNADVITLGFHVDYWDHDGWKDRFSSRAFTKRQEAYARQFGIEGTYTPQIVIDGSSELVGSNRPRANEEIARSAVRQKASIDLKIENDKLLASISG